MLAALAAALLLAAPAAPVATAPVDPAPAAPLVLGPAERDGKALFLRGERTDGTPLTARVGREGTRVPGSAAPCGSCHGADARGRPEGGARPSDITWGELAKPYGHLHPDGRRHPPFDAASFARAVRDGVDPAGNALDPLMPRYPLTEADLAALRAYLAVVDRDLDPGLSAGAIRIGVAVPDTGAQGEVGAGMRRILEARATELNRTGGVNGRRIELVAGGFPSATEPLPAVRRLVEEEKVFALVSGYFPRDEGRVEEFLEAEKVPLVGPFTPWAHQAASANPWVFFLSSGVREQARVLAAHAARDLSIEPARIAIVRPDDERSADAARAAREALGTGGAAALELVAPGEGPDGAMVRKLRDRKVRAVLLLGGDTALDRLGREAAAIGYAPTLLASGPLAARAAVRLPATFRGPVILAFPSVPSDETEAAAAALARLRGQAGLSDRNRASQAAALTAFEVLLEGLRRAGRDLSREKLVNALEGLWDVEPGLQRPVRYGPNRRVGSLGAWIVAVDREKGTFTTVGAFRELP